MDRLRLKQAVIVEGRDDVRAVQEACDALVIPTHGFGISSETWRIIGKAYEEKGIIILTDPDHAGEEIRRRLTERFPDALQAYVSRRDAVCGDDIGIENADPSQIRDAIERAAVLTEKEPSETDADEKYADVKDLTALGLCGAEDAAEKRAEVCKMLGIGYANSNAMIKKLRGFGIGKDELAEAVRKIQ